MRLKFVGGMFIFVTSCMISYKAGIFKSTYDFSRAISRASNGDEECIKVMIEAAKLGDELEQRDKAKNKTR